VPHVALIARAYGTVVLACLSQAEPPVRTAVHAIGVWVILAVVLPEAHRADFVAAAFPERDVSAARAGVGAAI
jgi:hypothetical protein